MLLELLHAAHYQAELSAKSKYMRGLLPLLRGQYELGLLQSEEMLRLLSNAQIRKGRAYTLKQLIQIANPQEETPRFMKHIASLASSGALIRGYNLQCPHCDLDTWYAVTAIGETVICDACRQEFQLPLELDFAFRPNRLLMEALKSGALAILLTLHLWLQDSPVTIWQSNIEVRQELLTTDIDLLVQREDGLFMAECKDNFEDLQELEAQLLLAQRIAKAIQAEFVFASLAEIPSNLQAFCDKHAIKVLGRKELLKS